MWLCQRKPSSEKVEGLDFMREEKKLYAEVAKIYGKNESSHHEIVKKEKEIHPSFAVVPQTEKGNCYSAL